MTTPISDDEALELMTEATAAMLLFDRPVVFTLDIAPTASLIALMQLALRHPDAAKLNAAENMKEFILKLIERIDPEHGPLYTFLMLGFDPQYDMLDERLAGVGEVDRLIVEGILEEVDQVVSGEGFSEVGRLFLSMSRRERLAQIVFERRTK